MMEKTWKPFNKKKILVLCFLITFTAFILNSIKVYSKEDEKNVLFISSYNESFLSVPEQINGIRDAFQTYNINLDVEYMDSKRFTSLESRHLFYQLLTYKLLNLEPYDAIIVGDDNALQFAMDYQSELFYEKPIIFLGINDTKRAELAAKNEYITGIIEEMSLKENVEIGLKFNPKAKSVVAIVDDTETGLGEKNQFYQIEDQFKQLDFRHINTADYTYDELKGVLNKIDNDTILIYFSMHYDKNGVHMTIPEAVEFLRDNTKVPILRAEIGGVGQGILGGKMISYYESGKIAADICLQVFGGTPIASIALITESPNQYIFDYALIKKYNIDEDLIPKDAVLINNKVNIYEKYKYWLIRGSLSLMFAIIIIIILINDLVKRRRIEKELQNRNEELTQIFEELAASEDELRSQYEALQNSSEEMQILNQKYKIAIESTDSAVWEFDIEKKEISISKNFTNAINKSLKEREDIHVMFDLIMTKENQIKIINEYESYQNGEKDEINIQIPVIDQDNKNRWILIRGRGLQNSKEKRYLIHGIMLEITKMKEQENYIRHIANHDYLTNLPNRLQFMKILKDELVHKKKGTILLLDIDNFKSINDNLGHIYGDKVLLEISKRLEEIINKDFIISRFGGDEFLMLIKNIDDSSIIEFYIQDMLKLFEWPFIIENKEQHVKFSIGITCFPKDSDDVDQLIMNADTAMYHVKRNGKNSFEFYCDDMKEELSEKYEIEEILADALKNDGFFLVYQPQIRAKTGEVIGFEALIRLKRYNLSPMKFISIAEETGQIINIGRWVTKEAINQIVRWRERGFKIKPIAINFSSSQIKDVGYIDYLENLLREKGIDPKYIEIEITESILLEKSENSLNFLNRISNLGLNISLDDFGTGYSSLNYLTYMPVNKIKLDKSLSEKFLKLDNTNVLHSLIALAHSLNLLITAEGIEDIEQYKRLLDGGCDFIQGYLFSKPLPENEIIQIYDHNFLNKL